MGPAAEATEPTRRRPVPRPSAAAAPARGSQPGGVTRRGYVRRGTTGGRPNVNVGVSIGSRVGGYVSYGRSRNRYRGYGARYGSRYYYGPYGYQSYSYVGSPYAYGSYGYGPQTYGYSPYYYGTRYGYGVANHYLGAVRLQVRPRHAEVFVDGYYVGQVDDFDGVFQRLRLEDGAYEIAIEAPGYEPLVFEIRLVPGQTINYRGTLLRLP